MEHEHLMRGMQLQDDGSKCADFLVSDMKCVGEIRAMLQAPEAKQDSQGQSKERDFIYKADHLEFYKMAGFKWPPSLEDEIVEGYQIFLKGLPERQQELTIFCHRMWPSPPGEEFSFLDANSSLGIIINAKVDDPDMKEWRTPWAHEKPMCLVGSSSMIVRITSDTGNLIRPMEGFEYFSLMGWCGSDCELGVPIPATPMCANLCGNVFSIRCRSCDVRVPLACRAIDRGRHS